MSYVIQANVEEKFVSRPRRAVRYYCNPDVISSGKAIIFQDKASAVLKMKELEDKFKNDLNFIYSHWCIESTDSVERCHL